MVVLRKYFKRLARLGGLMGVLLSQSSICAIDHLQTAPETMWVVTPPVDGECAPGDRLHPGCLSPTVKPSKCSCLRPVIIQVPLLEIPRTRAEYLGRGNFL